MKRKLLYFSLFLALVFGTSFVAVADYGVQAKTASCTSNQILPDSACTPGAVLTTDISVICKSGYTKTVRNVPLTERKQVFVEYGVSYSQRGKYEVDHLISLELGGSNDISNLWPENSTIKSGSLTKDKFENYLHSQVCGGKMTIAEAQMEISSNWLQYYSAVLANTNPKKSTTPKSTSPQTPPVQSAPTAKCKDGTYSYSSTHSGTCSGHKGVSVWYK